MDLNGSSRMQLIFLANKLAYVWKSKQKQELHHRSGPYQFRLIRNGALVEYMWLW